ncbi:MAG: hypothetical protein AAGA48_17350 [Myxococcota bacterium]
MPLRPLALFALLGACNNAGFVPPPGTEGTVTVPDLPDPCIVIEPTVVDFGPQVVGAVEPAVASFLVRNTCLSPITILGLESDQEAPPFELSAPVGPAFTLRAKESRSFGVVYEPTLYVDQASRMFIVSDDAVLPVEVVVFRGSGICEDGITDDTDGDLVPDGCDRCEGFDDRVDSDFDGVPDECDFCPFVDDALDYDYDGVADPCDLCPFGDDLVDTDEDSVPDDCDLCPLGPDNIDTDFDGIPDGCDICPDASDFLDEDGDSVPNGCDICEGSDDALDSDADLVPDGCDACEGFDDQYDADLDTVPDACDACAGEDDLIDTDGDGIPDGCDPE